jgi:uncharacterized protein (DUF2342 family)
VGATAGVAGLNHAWLAPESMPTWAELEDPASWLARAA